MAIDPYSKETETCQLCGNVLDQEVWVHCIVVRGKVLVACTTCQSRSELVFTHPIPLPTLPQESQASL